MARSTTITAIVAAAAAPLFLHAHPDHAPAGHHHHNFQPGMHLLPPGEQAHIGGAPRHGFPIYENLQTTGFRYTLFDTMIADDLHMISGGDMIAFTFVYAGSEAFCQGYWNGNATIRFYENNANNSLLPSTETLIETFNVPVDGTGASSYVKHVDLNQSVTLPQHIWMGISFDFNVIGGSGAVTAAAVPTVGTSLDAHFTGSAGYVTNPHAFAHANYAFAVYIPSPGAGGLLALAALGACRRRRPA